MSYDLQLFSIETMYKYQKSEDEDFFEHADHLCKFAEQQFEELKERLLAYEFESVKTERGIIEFEKPDSTILALLTMSGVYFQAGFNQDGIFDVIMMASEFTDTGEFTEYNPQSGEWESESASE